MIIDNINHITEESLDFVKVSGVFGLVKHARQYQIIC